MQKRGCLSAVCAIAGEMLGGESGRKRTQDGDDDQEQARNGVCHLSFVSYVLFSRTLLNHRSLCLYGVSLRRGAYAFRSSRYEECKSQVRVNW